jgi:hypothetical protein
MTTAEHREFARANRVFAASFALGLLGAAAIWPITLAVLGYLKWNLKRGELDQESAEVDALSPEQICSMGSEGEEIVIPAYAKPPCGRCGKETSFAEGVASLVWCEHYDCHVDPDDPPDVRAYSLCKQCFDDLAEQCERRDVG